MIPRRRPPRLLMVSPVASHPADQGNAQRILLLGEALAARGVVVEFLYHTAEGMTPAQEAAMRAHWHAFHVNHAERRPEPRFAGAWSLDDWCAPSLLARVAALHAARRYDAVLAHYVWLSRVLEAAPGAFTILDTHDVFGGRHDLAAAQGIDPSWFFTTEAEEARGLARAELVLAIQPEEAAVLRDRGPSAAAARVMVVGHAPALPPFLLRPPRQDVARAPFGTLASGNPWNLASVRALDAALAEAGHPPPWLLAGTVLRRLDPLALRTRPLLLEPLPRVEAFYDAVGCVLAPTMGGTGLKVKTVEALMSGRPVLGTRHAFAGLPATHPAHAAPDMAALVEMMRRHAAEPGFREEVALATRRLALLVAAEVALQQDALAGAIAAGVDDRRG